jgi:alpha-D-ribose 1-methylphosphonate 5-triphosphate synthase subunit PhnG
MTTANHLAVIERRMQKQNGQLILARAEGRDLAPILRRARRLTEVWRDLRAPEHGRTDCRPTP